MVELKQMSNKHDDVIVWSDSSCTYLVLGFLYSSKLEELLSTVLS